MQISEFNAMLVLAAAIIGMIALCVQAYNKWLDLQIARINMELAISKREAAEREIDSQSQSRSGNAAGIGRWLRRYFWRTQKSTVVLILLLFFAPPVWGNLIYGENAAPPIFVWTVSYSSPFCFLLGYLSVRQAAEAYLAHRKAEFERRLSEEAN